MRRACAGKIVRQLATQAFRGSLSERDFNGLMRFYNDGRKEGPFEYAIGAAIEAILASPQFLFRLENAPQTAKAGDAYRLGDSELLSRLSYFLWDAGPDAELAKSVAQGGMRAPGGYEKLVARMLADQRSSALATRFARQWLRLGDVETVLPDAVAYPYFDRTLGDAFVKESELFFDSLVREDRSILDLITADYSFVNERIARHYGIPNITGNAFRRVTLPEERRGILTHGSVLVLTSVADRTSPVMRGKWVMEVMMGSPPPPPPPGVPTVEETKGTADGKVLTVRERMEQHRKNPQCMSCHRVIDPLGLALENFDVDRQVANQGRRRARRCQRHSLRRHADERASRTARRAAQASGCVPAELHREPDDLRAWPPHRAVGHVGGPQGHQGRRQAQLQDLGVCSGHRRQPAVHDGPHGARQHECSRANREPSWRQVSPQLSAFSSQQELSQIADAQKADSRKPKAIIVR